MTFQKKIQERSVRKKNPDQYIFLKLNLYNFSIENLKTDFFSKSPVILAAFVVYGAFQRNSTFWYFS